MGIDIGDALAIGLGGPGGWLAKRGIEAVGGAAKGAVEDTSHAAGTKFGEGVVDGIEAGIRERLSGALDGVRNLFERVLPGGEPHVRRAHGLLRSA